MTLQLAPIWQVSETYGPPTVVNGKPNGTTLLTTPDSSGNGFTSTLEGSPSPTLVPSPWSGFGNAFEFSNATSNGIKNGPWNGGGVTARSGTGAAAAFTLEARVKVSSTASGAVCGWYTGLQPPQLFTNGTGGNWSFFYTDLTGTQQSLSGGTVDTAAHVLAADYDGTTVRLYLDGTMIDSAALAGIFAYPSGANFWVGNDDTGEAPDATIDEVRWSSVARYASNGGYTPATGPFSTDADTVALYHLDTVALPTVSGPWEPSSVARSIWAKQLQVVVAGSDVTFFRDVPAEVKSWTSQEPFGDASAVIVFPAITSFDGLSVPPALPTGVVVGIAGTFTGAGYWQVSADGLVIAYGDASFFGDQLGLLNQPVTGMASSPLGYGYALVAADGGVFAYGSVPFQGSLPGSAIVPATPVVGIAVTATGNGYWLVTAGGIVYAYGDAIHHGNASITAPVTGIARSAGGAGYIIVSSDGNIYVFGDGVNHGNGIATFVAPYVGIATAPSIDGYTLVDNLGQAYVFGSDNYFGGVTFPLNEPANSITLNPIDAGYWISAGDGGVFGFGVAPFLGSVPGGGLPTGGSLSWLRLGASVTINRVDKDGGIFAVFEGVVADWEDVHGASASEIGLKVQIVGVLFQLDWYLAKPIVNLPFVGYDPTTGDPIFGWDMGTAIAQAINSVSNPTPGTAIGNGPSPAGGPSPYTGVACTPVETGILTVQQGQWDKLASSYLVNMLAQGSSVGGGQWTVQLTRPRTPVIRLKDFETIDWTVSTGGHGIAHDLSLDQTTAANVIYGQGTGPMALYTTGTQSFSISPSWANAKYPQLPPAAPPFPLGTGLSFAPGDGQTGLQPFTDWMRACGYPLTSQDTYLVTDVPDGHLDTVLIERFQIAAGYDTTGLVDINIWDAAFTPGTTEGAVSNVFYDPLWELPEVEPYNFTPSGGLIGASDRFNANIPRVERYEQMGLQVSKAVGILSATLEGERLGAPVWTGSITLTADPEEGSRFDIMAGQNILLRYFHGRDVLFHISAVSIDFTPSGMTAQLTVSAQASDLITLASIYARDASSHGVARQGRPNLTTLNTTANQVVFDSESSAGNVAPLLLPANTWVVIRVPFSQYGSVAFTSFSTTSPFTPFAMGVFSGPVTPVNLLSIFGGTGPLVNDVAGNNPWNDFAVALDNLGLLYAAGGPDGPCGYWPSDPNGTQTLTGEYVDGQTWPYAPAPGYAPWLWVAFWAPNDCRISGRFLPAPA